MNRQTRIEKILQKELEPNYLEVLNESDQHSVPPGSESHFRILIVSDRFVGLSRVERQRLINDLLKSELSSGLHALGQRTLTVSEWEQARHRDPLVSPECASKKSI